MENIAICKANMAALPKRDGRTGLSTLVFARRIMERNKSAAGWYQPLSLVHRDEGEQTAQAAPSYDIKLSLTLRPQTPDGQPGAVLREKEFSKEHIVERILSRYLRMQPFRAVLQESPQKAAASVGGYSHLLKMFDMGKTMVSGAGSGQPPPIRFSQVLRRNRQAGVTASTRAPAHMQAFLPQAGLVYAEDSTEPGTVQARQSAERERRAREMESAEKRSTSARPRQDGGHGRAADKTESLAKRGDPVQAGKGVEHERSAGKTEPLAKRNDSVQPRQGAEHERPADKTASPAARNAVQTRKGVADELPTGETASPAKRNAAQMRQGAGHEQVVDQTEASAAPNAVRLQEGAGHERPSDEAEFSASRGTAQGRQNAYHDQPADETETAPYAGYASIEEGGIGQAPVVLPDLAYLDAQEDRAVQKPAVIEDSAVQKTAAREERPVQKPTAQEDSSVQKPTVQEDRSAQKPIMREDRAVQKPIAREASSAQKPTAREGGAVQKPAAREDSTVQKPDALEESAWQEPAALEERTWQEMAPAFVQHVEDAPERKDLHEQMAAGPLLERQLLREDERRPGAHHIASGFVPDMQSPAAPVGGRESALADSTADADHLQDRGIYAQAEPPSELAGLPPVSLEHGPVAEPITESATGSVTGLSEERLLQGDVPTKSQPQFKSGPSPETGKGGESTPIPQGKRASVQQNEDGYLTPNGEHGYTHAEENAPDAQDRSKDATAWAGPIQLDGQVVPGDAQVSPVSLEHASAAEIQERQGQAQSHPIAPRQERAPVSRPFAQASGHMPPRLENLRADDAPEHAPDKSASPGRTYSSESARAEREDEPRSPAPAPVWQQAPSLPPTGMEHPSAKRIGWRGQAEPGVETLAPNAPTITHAPAQEPLRPISGQWPENALTAASRAHMHPYRAGEGREAVSDAWRGAAQNRQWRAAQGSAEAVNPARGQTTGKAVERLRRAKDIRVTSDIAAALRPSSAAQVSPPQTGVQRDGYAPVGMAYFGPAAVPREALPGQMQGKSGRYQESEYVQTLPGWARDFLKDSFSHPVASQDNRGTAPAGSFSASSGVIAAAHPPSQARAAGMGQAQETWVAPGYAGPPAKMAHRQKEEVRQQQPPLRLSDAEIERMAKKVYGLVEERFKRNSRRMGM